MESTKDVKSSATTSLGTESSPKSSSPAEIKRSSSWSVALPERWKQKASSWVLGSSKDPATSSGINTRSSIPIYTLQMPNQRHCRLLSSPYQYRQGHVPCPNRLRPRSSPGTESVTWRVYSKRKRDLSYFLDHTSVKTHFLTGSTILEIRVLLLHQSRSLMESSKLMKTLRSEFGAQFGMLYY